MTDEELMKMYQLGNIEAFQDIYQRYQARIFGYLKKRGLTNEMAEDVFQQVFSKFHHTRLRYNPKYPLSAWLFTLTRNTLIDEHRKNQKLKNNVNLDSIAELSNSPETAEKHKIKVPLDALSQTEKNLIEDRFFNEKTYEEISHELGILPTNARQRVSRAVKKLKTIFKRRSHET